MGRGKRNRQGNKVAGTASDDRNKKNQDRRVRVLENEQFVNYYQAQNIVPENEWDTMYELLKIGLPASFRINAGGAFAAHIRERFQNEFSKGYPLTTKDKNDNDVTIERAPYALPWYPNNNGWQLGTSRTVLRRTPALKPLHQYMVRENTTGSISRQEQVSMIPPFFLDVQPHHSVLDMCASPGSKTVQLLEFLHAKESEGVFPTGMVVANDVSYQRAYMLVTQCKRMSSASLTVTAHPAQWFPSLARLRYNESTDENKGELPEGTFDRILADVPCSGDGTLRKSPDMWRTWNEGGGMALHGLQLKIAMRGAALLKVGGCMVYSTCSLNPIENEAVVAELLLRCKGVLELVDCSEKYPLLKRRPGMKTWKFGLQNKQGRAAKKIREEKAAQEPKEDNKTEEDDEEIPMYKWFETFEEYNTFVKEMDKTLKKHVPALPSMFPPAKDKVDDLNLERCMRLVPHDQDTGGFFVCVLKKVAPLSKSVRESSGVDELPSEAELKKQQGKIRTKGRGAPPKHHQYYPCGKENYERIKEYYGIKDSFAGAESLFTRDEKGDSNVVSLVSPATVDMCFGFKNQNKLHMVHTGVSVFKKNESKHHECEYRMVQDGVKYVYPHMTKRIIKVTIKDAEALLFYNAKDKRETEEAKKFYAKYPGTPINRLSKESEEKMNAISTGCIVVALTEEEQAKYVKTFGHTFAISCWKGNKTINAMVNKQELETMHEQFVEAGISSYDFDSFDIDQDKQNAIKELIEKSEKEKKKE